MGMSLQTEGMEEISRVLNQLQDKAEGVATAAVFAGAGVVADALSAAAGHIVAEPFHYLARPDITGTKRYASLEEKAAVQGKTGIAKFNKSGSEVDTVVGFTGNAGYVTIGGKQRPVDAIARSINSGTSFMHKQPVFRKAISQSRGSAQAAMVDTAEQRFEQIING